MSIPSIQFCLTGRLMNNERYNQEIHNYGSTIRQRAPQLLDWYSINQIDAWTSRHKNNLTDEQIADIYSVIYPIPIPQQ